MMTAMEFVHVENREHRKSISLAHSTSSKTFRNLAGMYFITGCTDASIAVFEVQDRFRMKWIVSPTQQIYREYYQMRIFLQFLLACLQQN